MCSCVFGKHARAYKLARCTPSDLGKSVIGVLIFSGTHCFSLLGMFTEGQFVCTHTIGRRVFTQLPFGHTHTHCGTDSHSGECRKNGRSSVGTKSTTTRALDTARVHVLLLSTRTLLRRSPLCAVTIGQIFVHQWEGITGKLLIWAVCTRVRQSLGRGGWPKIGLF